MIAPAKANTSATVLRDISEYHRLHDDGGPEVRVQAHTFAHPLRIVTEPGSQDRSDNIIKLLIGVLGCL